MKRSLSILNGCHPIEQGRRQKAEESLLVPSRFSHQERPLLYGDRFTLDLNKTWGMNQ
ncbi:hypothetical protein [Coleofasciculus chthonoplastes]|uniref:hypothetical protein n=1 Tax=Coleofasciculus chthonoplastes TaxID=64178 RepID=UPI004062F05F